MCVRAFNNISNKMNSSIKEELKGDNRQLIKKLVSTFSEGGFDDFISQSEKQKSCVKEESRLMKEENLSTVGMMTVRSE